MQTSALNAELNAALTDVKAKDRQKVEVLGYVGHDLRAPLATISGYSALLLAGAHERRKVVQTIQRSVKYQLDLIDELLEYAKGELRAAGRAARGHRPAPPAGRYFRIRRCPVRAAEQPLALRRQRPDAPADRAGRQALAAGAAEPALECPSSRATAW